MGGYAWTATEDAVLRENYAKVGAAGCADLLPNRTADAIVWRVCKLRIRGRAPGGAKHGHLWPLAETLYLAGIRSELIAAETGIPFNTLSNYITTNGLREVREIAMVDRIAEIRAEFEQDKAA